MSPEARRLDTLLEHAAWIRQLARALVRDPARAEDVAQETLVAAWKHAPLDERGLRGWLTQVARNFARVQTRSQARRERHETHAARPEAQPSSHEVVERVEVQRELVAAVLELDEPYRTVLLLRFYEAKPPRAIARELGRPIATVRSQLARGLALLRGRLDQSHGGRSQWALLLAPLARPGTLLTFPLAGAILMNAKIQIAAALAVVAGAALILTLTQGGNQTPQPELAADTSEPRAAALDATPTPRIEGGTEAPLARTAIEAARPADPAPLVVPAAILVRGRVLDSAATPLAGVVVELAASSPALRATSGSDGRFELETQGRTGRVRGADPRYETVFAGVLERGTRELQVVVAPRTTCSGEVQDEKGAPLAGALVSIWPAQSVRTRFAQSLDQAENVPFDATSDDLGRFRLESVPLFDGMRIDCELSGFEGWSARLPDVAGGEITITLRRVGAEVHAVRGRVVDSQGHATGGAFVALGMDTTSTDERGGFALKLDDPDSMSHGWSLRPSLLRAVKAGQLPAEFQAELVDGAPLWPDFVLLKLGGAPLSLCGRVLESDGKPFAGALVWVANTTTLGYGPDGVMQVESLLGGSSDSWTRVESDAQGRFEIHGLLERSYTLVALDPHRLRRAIAREVAAGSRSVELAFRSDDLAPRVAGRVLDARGKGVPDVRVGLAADVFEAKSGAVRVMKRSFPLEGVLTDAEGRFELADVPLHGAKLRVDSDAIIPVEIGVAGFAEDGSSEAALAHFLGAHPDQLEIKVELRVHVQLELVDPGGAPAFALLDGEGQAVDMCVFMGTSSFYMTRAPCHEGRSQVVSATERARWLVLSRDGKETQRVPIAPVPGETLHVKL